MFEPGAAVSFIERVGSVSAGAIGIVIGRYANDGSLLVEVALGMQVRAAESAVEYIDDDPFPTAA